MICESAILMPLLRKINKFISRFPISCRSFSSISAHLTPSINGNDFLSSISQIQSSFLHALHYYHIPATTITHSDNCSPFLPIPLSVISPLQSASKMSFQMADLGTSLLRLKLFSASSLSLGKIWHQSFVIEPLGVSVITSLPVSILYSCSPNLCKLSSGATKTEGASYSSKLVRRHSQYHPGF